jgi:hypothetical protein
VSEQYEEDEFRGEGDPHLVEASILGSKLMEGMKKQSALARSI